MGALVMYRIRCIVVLAEGGFKINGPPRVGKGPMSQGNNLGMRGEAFPPQPAQAGRIETCMELIRQAMRCLENNDKQCVTRLIEELVKADCHNGNAVGREVADKVRDVVHELWLVSNHEEECRLLRILRDLGVSRSWARIVTRITNPRQFNERLERCGISWKSRAMRNDVVKEIEDLLRRLGWSEVGMCEELWRFVGVDVDEFRRHGIEPCIWLEGINELSNLRNPYWLGLRASDLSVKKYNKKVRLILNTTNAIDAVFFLKILGTIRTPSLVVEWKNKAPTAKYVSRSIALSFYVDLDIGNRPWPIKLNADELEKMIKNFNDKELAMFIAGALDGDGSIWYNGSIYVTITVCKNCPKRFILDMLKKVIAERFGIVGSDRSLETADALVFRGRNAVRLLRRIVKYMHHPLKRLRAELILAYYNGKISKDEFTKLYEMTKYEQGRDDIKRNRGLGVLIRAAPQTHTHGDKTEELKQS